MYYGFYLAAKRHKRHKEKLDRIDTDTYGTSLTDKNHNNSVFLSKNAKKVPPEGAGGHL